MQYAGFIKVKRVTGNRVCGQSSGYKKANQNSFRSNYHDYVHVIIDHEPREIMYFIASVCPSIRLSVSAKSKEESLSVRGVCLYVE